MCNRESPAQTSIFGTALASAGRLKPFVGRNADRSDRVARYCGSRFNPFTSSIQIGPSSATIFSKKT